MLLGAIDAFAERGFHATTTRDIAARAGLSPAALYVHYPSKAAVLAQISLRGHRMALDLATRAVAATTDAVVALRSLVADFVSWHAENHRVARVVQYELHALPEDARDEVRALRRRIEQLVEDLIRTGIEQGVMDAAEPRRVARAVLSLGIDVARWYDPAGRDTPAALGELYADLAVRMVGGREPPVEPRPRPRSDAPVAADPQVVADVQVAAEPQVAADARITVDAGRRDVDRPE
jgi:AcrR family transcriptional regulator